jgi:hypothetical protein
MATGQLSELGAVTPPLFVWVLAPVTGTVTLKGYFVDDSGYQVTSLITMTFTTAKTLTELYNTAASLTAGTVLANPTGGLTGFRGTLSADVYFSQGGNTDGTIKSGMTPAAGYPKLLATDDLGFGRVYN